jgi:hypothetical protein
MSRIQVPRSSRLCGPGFKTLSFCMAFVLIIVHWRASCIPCRSSYKFLVCFDWHEKMIHLNKWWMFNEYLLDKVYSISAAYLLTGFIQAGFQCWEDIRLSTWTQRVWICGCSMFSSVLILASTKQDNSWLLQSWCRGQWTWCSEDYTIWKVRYSGK